MPISTEAIFLQRKVGVSEKHSGCALLMGMYHGLGAPEITMMAPNVIAMTTCVVKFSLLRSSC